MNIVRTFIVSLLLAPCCAYFLCGLAWAEEPTKNHAPYFGEEPLQPEARLILVDEIKKLPADELDALLNISISCRVNAGSQPPTIRYELWDKECNKVRTVWNAKYKKSAENWRELDNQLMVFGFSALGMYTSSFGVDASSQILTLNRRSGNLQETIKAANKYEAANKEWLAQLNAVNQFTSTLVNLINEARQSR